MSGHTPVVGKTPASPPRLKRRADLLRQEKPDLLHRDALVSRHELCDVDNGGWNITKSPYQNKKEPSCRASLAKARTQRPKSSMP